jgi:hypothetical protein
MVLKTKPDVYADVSSNTKYERFGKDETKVLTVGDGLKFSYGGMTAVVTASELLPLKKYIDQNEDAVQKAYLEALNSIRAEENHGWGWKAPAALTDTEQAEASKLRATLSGLLKKRTGQVDLGTSDHDARAGMLALQALILKATGRNPSPSTQATSASEFSG